MHTRSKQRAIPRIVSPGETVDRIAALFLALALGLPAFMSNGGSLKPLTYGLVILPTLYLILSRRLDLRELWRKTPAVVLLAIPLLYWSATNLWSAEPEAFESFLRRSLTQFLFILGVAHISRSVGDELARYLDISLFLVAIGAALVLISLPFFMPLGTWRPGDGSVFNRALHASHYFGFFAIYALVRCYQAGRGPLARACLAAALACFVYVLVTESRGTLLALILVGLVVSLYWHRRYLHALILLLLCLVGFVFTRADLLERGLSYRPEIWTNALMMLPENLWVGIGMGVNLNIPYGENLLAPHAHNQWLDLLIRSGIPGLLFFILITVFILWRSIAPQPREQVFVAPLLFFLLCVVTDVHKLVNSPAASYLIFWAPLAALLVCSSKTGERVASTASGEIRAEPGGERST